MPLKDPELPAPGVGIFNTPGCRNVNCVRSRLINGSSTTLLASTRLDTVADVVSRRAASPLTSTASVMFPTFSSRSTTAVRPTVRLIPLRLVVWKPVSSALTA